FLPPRPPTPTLFPYTTLFRSRRLVLLADRAVLSPARLPQLDGGREPGLGRTRHRRPSRVQALAREPASPGQSALAALAGDRDQRSEEHTSELQSRGHLVCRLL